MVKGSSQCPVGNGLSPLEKLSLRLKYESSEKPKLHWGSAGPWPAGGARGPCNENLPGNTVIHRISLKGPEGKSDFWLWFVFVLHFFSSNFWAFKEMDTLVNIWYHSVPSFS